MAEDEVRMVKLLEVKRRRRVEVGLSAVQARCVPSYLGESE